MPNFGCMPAVRSLNDILSLCCAVKPEGKTECLRQARKRSTPRKWSLRNLPTAYSSGLRSVLDGNHKRMHTRGGAEYTYSNSHRPIGGTWSTVLPVSFLPYPILALE
jgi:hypothetical protein